MARHQIASPEVQSVVEPLCELFLHVGSVSALQKHLASKLAADEGSIYPNRLQTLLGGDTSRSINTQTLETIQLALDRGGPEIESSRETQVRSAILNAAAGTVAASHDARIQTVYERTGLPRGVIARVLGLHRKERSAGMHASGHGVQGVGPDWSFQDDACSSCVRSLELGPNRKVGLILPTGGGKTRLAVRIALTMLAQSDRPDSEVVWVTHRTRLRVQARRELARAMRAGTQEIPSGAAAMLANRVRMIMLKDLAATLRDLGEAVALVVVDEAHHAAAPSYQPIFDHVPVRGLFLTATPNRTDELPIGIDDIAYTIRYRELFQRGVIIEPTFEEPLTIDRLDWSDPTHLRDLGDYILDRAEADFDKTLVVASRRDQVEALHDTLHQLLDDRKDHSLTHDDIAYVHGSGTSTGLEPHEFLDESAASPQGIIISTSQMLGEGFDDPSINAVVVTYPSTSMIQLMQAAGRALRSAPGKDSAYVVQVRDSDVAYHFEQRWLYQDISDLLHPQIVDVSYSVAADLRGKVSDLLESHRVDEAVREAVLNRLPEVNIGSGFSLLLSGRPYHDAEADFHTKAVWSAVPFGAEERSLFLRVFNDFSGREAEVQNNADFLRNYLQPNSRRDSDWTLLIDMLHAMSYARKELRGDSYAGREKRPYQENVGTTWLTYVTLVHRPTVPNEFVEFFHDAHNRSDLFAEFEENPDRFSLALKIPHPLAGTIGYLLEESEVDWLDRQRLSLEEEIRRNPPGSAYAVLEQWRLGLERCPIPLSILHRFEVFVGAESYAAHSLPLGVTGYSFADQEDLPQPEVGS